MLQRNALALAGFWLILSNPAIRAADDAKAILDQAIKAMGGADKLAKLPATTFKSQGTILFNGAKYNYTDDWEVQAPDKFRWHLNLTINERAVPLTLVFTDKSAWAMGDNGQANDVPDEFAHMFKVDCRATLLAHWLTAIQEKGTELTSIGELKIDDRPALGLKASCKGFPDVDLFFDKETHLPLKMEVRFKETKDGPEVAHTWKFDEYKEADDVKYFSKVKLFRDDKQLVDMEVTELKRVEKIDELRFTKP